MNPDVIFLGNNIVPTRRGGGGGKGVHNSNYQSVLVISLLRRGLIKKKTARRWCGLYSLYRCSRRVIVVISARTGVGWGGERETDWPPDRCCYTASHLPRSRRTDPTRGATSTALINRDDLETRQDGLIETKTHVGNMRRMFLPLIGFGYNEQKEIKK